MKYYIIAGEASGDLHGSNLIKSLKVHDNEAVFRCWGGDMMKNNGAELVKHYRDLAFMGFIEVLLHLKTILRNIAFCKKDILSFNPDALILIDYPGFNLRIAKWAKQNNIKVFYYIAPQVWAWHKSRIKIMRKVIDRLYVILPFEKSFFENNNLKAEFVGHPLLDAIDNHNFNTDGDNILNSNNNDKPIIALLPGSRKQEIKKMLPFMVQLSDKFRDFRFVVAAVNTLPIDFYKKIIGDYDVDLIVGKTYNLLGKSKAAVVTSGTATLETALFNVPQIVCYKGNYLSYLLAKNFIQVKYISLVNLILDKPAVKELIQSDLTIENLIVEFEKITQNEKVISEINNDYKELTLKLEGKGASEKTAKSIINQLTKRND
jgi:lipid-A-disaccharide synthase